MIKIKRFNENILFDMNISQFLKWIKNIKGDFIFSDTETTGLPSNYWDVQLTQISAVSFSNKGGKFNEVNKFNKKIKLGEETKKSLNTDIRRVLSFNRYGSKSKYFDEVETINMYKDFIEEHNNPHLVFQNADFDLRYLNSRGNVKFDYPVIDTKDIIRLFYIPTLQKLSESDKYYKDIINRIGTSDRDGGLISSSMSKIAPVLDIDTSGYHDALFDCYMTVEMLEKIMDFLEENKNLDIKKYQDLRIDKLK